MANKYHIVESVSEGHPDKVCDQIAEAILDYCLKIDSNAHVACEVFVTKFKLIIGGEVRFHQKNIKLASLKSDISQLAKSVINQIGYTPQTWKSLNELKIDYLINEQSNEIHNQVDQNNSLKFGDNTIAFGHATSIEHIQYFPIKQAIANLIMQKLNLVRKNPNLNRKWNMAPDGKIEIIWKNQSIDRIFLSQQFVVNHNQSKDHNFCRHLFTEIILPVISQYNIQTNQNLVNNFKLTAFFEGGPSADTGLTGRKLMIDSYGTLVNHGGGSYIGKDVTKGDLTLALYARFIAKHLVKSKLCKTITIKVSTVIGNKDVFVKTTSKLDNFDQINRILKAVFKWDLSKIVAKLNLKKLEYRHFATYGFFGRDDIYAPWEQIDDEIIRKIQDHQ